MGNETAQPIVEYRNRFDAGSGYRDRLMAIPLLMVRIECNTKGLVFEGECLDVGWVEMPIYKNRLAAAQALVETMPEKVVEAKKLFAEEEARLGKDRDAHRTFTSWVQAYGAITGGKSPGAFNSLEVIREMGPPASDGQLVAEATTRAIVEGLADKLSGNFDAPAKSKK